MGRPGLLEKRLHLVEKAFAVGFQGHTAFFGEFREQLTFQLLPAIVRKDNGFVDFLITAASMGQDNERDEQETREYGFYFGPRTVPAGPDSVKRRADVFSNWKMRQA